MNQRASTFAEVAREWLANKEQFVKRGTYSIYALQIEKHLLPVFREHQAVTEEQAQGFILEKLQQGLSLKTTKDLVILLKMIIRHAIKYYGWQYVEMELKYPTACIAPRIEVLPRVHQRKIMQYVRDHFTFRNLGILICLFPVVFGSVVVWLIALTLLLVGMVCIGDFFVSRKANRPGPYDDGIIDVEAR